MKEAIVVVLVLLSFIPFSIALFFVRLYEKSMCIVGRHDVSMYGLRGSNFAQDICNRCGKVWPNTLRGQVSEVQFHVTKRQVTSPLFAITALNNKYRYGSGTISRDELIDYLNELKDQV